jgi:hypothetical protein
VEHNPHPSQSITGKVKGFRSRDHRGQEVAIFFSRMLSLHCKCEVVLCHVEEQHLVCFQVAGQHVAIDYTADILFPSCISEMGVNQT